MALSSQEALQADLAKALAWRKKEINQLCQSASLADDGASHLFRAGLVLLCAHWEGFLKSALDAYIDHVVAQNRKHRELLPCFVAVSFFADVRAAAATSYPGHEESHLKLAERIVKEQAEVCSRRSWWATVEGNPGSESVRRLLSSAGLNDRLNLDEATWSTTKVFIDEQILRDRNGIAHGEGLPLSKKEFLDRAHRMTALLDRVADLVNSSASSRLYLVSP